MADGEGASFPVVRDDEELGVELGEDGGGCVGPNGVD